MHKRDIYIYIYTICINEMQGLPVATPERATNSSVKSKMGITRPVTHKRKRKKCW